MTPRKDSTLFRLSDSVRRARVGLVAVAVAAVLAACSGGGSAPSASAGGSASTASCTTPDANGVVKLSAKDISFDTNCIQVPAGEKFTIEFTNNDSTPHDVAIYNDNSKATELFRGDPVSEQGKTVTYEVPALEAGEHYFECTIHPMMNGKVVAQ
jgi:plastocyanin